MPGLPYNAHKYLIEPLEVKTHVKQVLVKRFLQLCENLGSFRKKVVKDTFNKIKCDVRTTTRSNLAEIGVLLGIPPWKLTCSYAKAIKFAVIVIKDEENNRISFIKEIIDLMHSNISIDGFTKDEFLFILHHICTS